MTAFFQYSVIHATTSRDCTRAPVLDAANELVAAFQLPFRFRLVPVPRLEEPQNALLLHDVMTLLDQHGHFAVLGTLSLETSEAAFIDEAQSVDLLAANSPFHYFSLNSLVQDLLEFDYLPAFAPSRSSSQHRVRLRHSLLCRDWLNQLQASFAHGDKNNMMLPAYQRGWARSCENIRRVLDGNTIDCAGQSACPVKERVSRFSLTPDSFREDMYPQLRSIANEQCESALLLLTDAHGGTRTLLRRFRRAYIVENDESVAGHLRNQLQGFVGGQRRYLGPWPTAATRVPGTDELDTSNVRDNVYTVDVGQSLATGLLVTESGEKFEWSSLGVDDLVTIDLELGQPKDKFNIRPDGVRLAYQCALHAPDATRIVISAESHLESVTRLSGTQVFLEKPFTKRELTDAICAAARETVVWICSDPVRREWEVALQRLQPQLRFNDVVSTVSRTLGQERIRLLDSKVTDDCEELHATIVVLDVVESPDTDVTFPSIDATINRVAFQFRSIVTSNSSAQVIVLLPRHDQFQRPDGLIQRLYRLIRPDQDRIIHKPIAVGSTRLHSFEKAVLDLILARPQFDVRYRVLTPVIGLIWPRVMPLLRKHDSECTVEQRVVKWSPLAVIVGEFRGFNYSVEAITADAGLPKLLIDRLGVLQKSQKWADAHGECDAKTLVDDFISFTKISSHLSSLFPTIESWMREALNSKADLVPGQKRVMTLDQLTGTLTRTFGGETRHEFVSRGGWYDDSGQLIQDIPLVLEFCAKKGVVAREAVKATIAAYLTQMGGEDVVLMTEEPIQGFLWS